MYVPGVNQLNDLSVICDFMRVNSFAIVVSLHNEVPVATHLPITMVRDGDGMKQGIVGFEIPVSQIQGKAKLSQNKNEAEQSRIADALIQSNNSEVIEVGYMMRHGFNLTSI